MRCIAPLVLVLIALCLPPSVAMADLQTFAAEPLPELPVGVEGGVLGVHGSALLVVGGAEEAAGALPVFVLPEGATRWQAAGGLERAGTPGAAVGTPQGVVVLGGGSDATASAEVQMLDWVDGSLRVTALPRLPVASAAPAAAAVGTTIYALIDTPVADGGKLHVLHSLDPASEAPAWQEQERLPGGSLRDAEMLALQDVLYVFGRTAAGEAAAFRLDLKPPGRDAGWTPITPPPGWAAGRAGMAFGHSHLFFFDTGGEAADASGGDASGGADSGGILAYHTFTDTWTTIGRLDGRAAAPRGPLVAALGDQAIVVSGRQVLAAAPQPVPTNYGTIDHAVVAVYLLGMIATGWYFSRREKSTSDFFRGGQRVPWWASGMSLFATGASAISLMAMPGMSYATNWTYFSISLAALVALPIALFVLAPLVRRLQIATANEYLERRFGLAARLLASVIYMFTQVAGRMASVMLLPAIALAAITGVDVIWCIVIMAVITTVYTYLGGLEAVIWTDTIQGFVMCATVAGCLALALWKLGMPLGEMVETLQSSDKLHVVDLSTSLVYPTLWIFLISTLVGTMGGIGDQNFVQRVQCTPTLRDAQKAVATQLGVAIPINLLLFGLGTALWLFYRSRPELLNPVMKTDGVFPFFAAQQLPVGVSGLVVAALLAATMSTISSSICSVSDLGVNDFYRRFNADATDHQALVLGKLLTAVVGLLGMGAAILMARSTMVSVWDLATLVIGLISNGIVGLFMLGLLTRRANQWGALAGVALGMASVIYLRTQTDITFWLYGFVGSAVTFVTGYLLSLALPGRPRDIAGLTVYTLRQAAKARPRTPETGYATPAPG